AVLVQVVATPTVRSQEAEELIVARPGPFHRVLEAVAKHDIRHQESILTRTQMHAVELLDELAVECPVLLEQGAVLVPENALWGLVRRVGEGGGAGHRLPDLHRRGEWLRDQSERLDGATAIVDAGRWQLVVLAMEGKPLVGPGELHNRHL